MKNTAITSHDACILCDDIEKFARKGKIDDDLRRSIAERIIKLQEAENELNQLFGYPGEGVDTVEDLEVYIQTETRGILRYVEGLGMDLFDLERSA